jgi:uncharacterized protein YcbX
MRTWDLRRFRINVILAGGGEEELVGSTVQAGTVELDVGTQISRCAMVTRPQPAHAGTAPIERAVDVLRTITSERAGNLGIGALVRTPGTITVGDRLSVAP